MRNYRHLLATEASGQFLLLVITIHYYYLPSLSPSLVKTENCPVANPQNQQNNHLPAMFLLPSVKKMEKKNNENFGLIPKKCVNCCRHPTPAERRKYPKPESNQKPFVLKCQISVWCN